MANKLTASLYWRLFLWLWLLLVGLAALLLLLPRLAMAPPMHLDGPPPRPVQHAIRLLEQGRPLPMRGGPYLLFDGDGNQLAGPPLTPGFRQLLAPAKPQPAAVHVVDGWHYIGPYLVQLPEQPALLYVRRPAPHYGAVLGRLISSQPWLAFGAILLVTALGCGWLGWRLSRPLRQLQQTAEQLAEGQWQQRPALALQQRGDEFGALARAMALMANALEQELSARQTLLHYVSHELKNPMTRLRLAAGLLRRRPDEAVLGQLEDAVTQLDERLNQVLLLTRSQTAVGRGQRLAFDQLLAAAAAEWQPRAAELGRQLIVQAQPLWLQGEPLLLRALLDNLLDNALRHARQQVRCQLRAEGEQLLLVVSDDGQGLQLEPGQDPFAPFVQGQGFSGQAGLGLAIVGAVARQHGGSASYQTAASGGLQISIHLPLAS